MSGKSKSMQPICSKCGKYPFVIVQHTCSAKEPLEGTPDILAELRARVMRVLSKADECMPVLERPGMEPAFNVAQGSILACNDFLAWLDELAPPSNTTAPDTTSGIASIP